MKPAHRLWILIACLPPLACSGTSGSGSGNGATSGNSHLDGGSGGGDEGGAGSPDGSTLGLGPYGSNGPTTFTSTSLQVPAPNGTFTTTVYLPSGAGPVPAVILSSALQQPSAAYVPYAERLASWGVITFLRNDPGVLGEASPAIAQDVGYMVATWLPAANAAASGPLAGRVDTTKIGLAGHSRGGQVSILAAAGDAQGLVRAIFGLDPVDSSADGGTGLAASVIAGVGVPIAFIGETTDSASDSCAPAANNYQVLYAQASSPIVALTAVNADHTMFEDPNNCTLCSFCTPGTANAAQVLATAQRYLMAFFARELLADTSVGATFAGAGVGEDIAAGTITLESK